MIIKKNLLNNLVFSIALFSLLLSNILYLNISSKALSLYFIISLPVFIFIIYQVKKIYFLGGLFSFYLFICLLFFISIVGVFFSGNWGGVSQIYIYVFIPLTFLYFGFLISESFIYKNIAAISFLVFLFSIGQFLYFNFSISGPLEIFKYFTDVIKQSQMDFEVELIGSRSSGVFVNPNILGFFAGLCFLILLYLKDKNNYFLIDLFILISLLMVFVSSSRTSILGIFLSVVFIIFIKYITTGNLNNLLKQLLGFVAIFGLSIYLLFKFSSEYYLERFLEIGAVAEQGSSGSQNLDGRVNAWNNLMNYIDTNPFGTIMPPQLVVDYSPDNQFIYFWLQGGYLLLISFIYLFISLFNKSIKYKSAYLFSVILFLFLSSFTFVTFNTFVIGLFWLFSGIVLKKQLNFV